MTTGTHNLTISESKSVCSILKLHKHFFSIRSSLKQRNPLKNCYEQVSFLKSKFSPSERVTLSSCKQAFNSVFSNFVIFLVIYIDAGFDSETTKTD